MEVLVSESLVDDVTSVSVLVDSAVVTRIAEIVEVSAWRVVSTVVDVISVILSACENQYKQN